MSNYSSLTAFELLSLFTTETLMELFNKSIHGDGKEGGVITATLTIHALVNRGRVDEISLDDITNGELAWQLESELASAKRSSESRVSKATRASLDRFSEPSEGEKEMLRQYLSGEMEALTERRQMSEKDIKDLLKKGILARLRTARLRSETASELKEFVIGFLMKKCPDEVEAFERHCLVRPTESKDELYAFAYKFISVLPIFD